MDLPYALYIDADACELIHSHFERNRIPHNRQGFTIVELLVVIVVIAILAAITIVAYNSVAVRARETVRASDVQLIAQALELYYLDHGAYPTVAPDQPCENENVATGSGVARSGCTNWTQLSTELLPYTGKPLPLDPKNRMGSTTDANTHTYFYWPVTDNATLGCASSQPYQSYYLDVFGESAVTSQYHYSGQCASTKTPTSYYGSGPNRSTYFVTHP